MKIATEATLIAAAVLRYLAIDETAELHAQSQPERNGWTIGASSHLPDRVRLSIDHSEDKRRTRWNSDVPWSSFQGLTSQQLSSLNGPHTFEFVRDAGMFVCTGQFSGGRGRGAYRFQPNQRYASQLQELGFSAPSPGDLYSLAVGDVSLEFARIVGADGIGASPRVLLELHDHGLTTAYLRDAQAAGFGRFTARDYIEIKNNGVRSDFLRALKNAGYGDVSVRQIVEMQNHGIDSRIMRELARFGLKPLPRDLIEMKNQGVSPAFLHALAQAGLSKLDSREVVELRNRNVTPEFIRDAKDMGYSFTAREMISMRSRGVDTAYLRKLRASGFHTQSAERIIKLRARGID